MAFCVPADDILTNRNPRGSRNINRARLAAYAYFRGLGMAYTRIGAIMDRDHTTVIHGCQMAAEMSETDDDFVERLKWIKLQ